jgi:hypothetical protein
VQLAIDAGFADAARDQLRVLRAEIENEDFFVMHFRVKGEWLLMNGCNAVGEAPLNTG